MQARAQRGSQAQAGPVTGRLGSSCMLAASCSQQVQRHRQSIKDKAQMAAVAVEEVGASLQSPLPTPHPPHPPPPQPPSLAICFWPLQKERQDSLSCIMCPQVSKGMLPHSSYFPHQLSPHRLSLRLGQHPPLLLSFPHQLPLGLLLGDLQACQLAGAPCALPQPSQQPPSQLHKQRNIADTVSVVCRCHYALPPPAKRSASQLHAHAGVQGIF